MNTETAELVTLILNQAQAGLRWLEARGVQRDRALSLLKVAGTERRDLRTEDVQAELDAGQKELEETQTKIDSME